MSSVLNKQVIVSENRSSGTRRPGLAFTAILVLLSLLAGGLEIHSHAGHAAAHAAELGFSGSYDPAASHPLEPKHFEASGEVEQPPCAACLHGLTLRGLSLPAATSLRVATGCARLPTAGPAALPDDPFRHGIGGRSPPLA